MNAFGCVKSGSYGIFGSSLFQDAPEGLRLPGPDAFRLTKGRDAPIRWRALFGRSELVRPPQVGVRPLLSDQTERHWFWGLLPEQKGLACRGETRPHKTKHGHESWGDSHGRNLGTAGSGCLTSQGRSHVEKSHLAGYVQKPTPQTSRSGHQEMAGQEFSQSLQPSGIRSLL